MNTTAIAPVLLALCCVASCFDQADAATIGYRTLVLADNPIAYYEMDESTGTSAANSGSAGATLDMDTLVGSGIASNQTSAADFLGTAYGFSGSGHLRAGAGVGGTLSEWTFEAWINYTSDSGRNTVFTNDAGGWNDDVIIGLGPDGQSGIPSTNFGVSQQGSPGSTRDTPSVALSADTWHHVAITGSDSAGEIKIYVDGSLVLTDDTLINGGRFGSNELAIGTFRAGSSTDQYNGLIDEIAVYDQVLTEADLAARANFTSVVPEPASVTLLAMGGLIIAGRRRRA